MRGQIRRVSLVVAVFAGCLGALGALAQHTGAEHGGDGADRAGVRLRQPLRHHQRRAGAVTVTFRVAGTDEEGSASLDAAPRRGPAFQRSADRDAEPRDGRAVPGRQAGRSAENDGSPARRRPPAAQAAAGSRTPAHGAHRSTGRSWRSTCISCPTGGCCPGARPAQRQARAGHRSGTRPPAISAIALSRTGCSAPAIRSCRTAGCWSRAATSATSHGLPDINLFSAGAGWVSASADAARTLVSHPTTMAYGQVVILAGRDEERDRTCRCPRSGGRAASRP